MTSSPKTGTPGTLAFARRGYGTQKAQRDSARPGQGRQADKERATGAGPATSSLGRGASVSADLREKASDSCVFKRLREEGLFPGCPKMTHCDPRKREPFPVSGMLITTPLACPFRCATRCMHAGEECFQVGAGSLKQSDEED